MSARLRAWMELARVSNLPTVWSNVLMGMVLGFLAGAASGQVFVPPVERWQLAVLVMNESLGLLVAMSLLYVGGMMLNDVVDVEVDRRERPARPLASGRVSVPAAGAAVCACFAGGLALLMTHEQWQRMLVLGLVLVAAIVLYDIVHKRSAWAAALMGACRALVYMTAASMFPASAAAWGALVVPAAIGLAGYTTVVTLIARGEATDARSRAGGRVHAAGAVAMGLALLPGLALGAEAGAGTFDEMIALAVAAALLVAWLAWAWRLLAIGQTKRAVMGYLAGIALFDAYVLALVGWWTVSGVAVACFSVTVLLHRRIAGT